MGKIAIRARIKYSPFREIREYEYEDCKIKLIPDDIMEVIDLEVQDFEEWKSKGLETINQFLSMMAYKRRTPLSLDYISNVFFNSEITGVPPKSITMSPVVSLRVKAKKPLELTPQDIPTYSKNEDIKLKLALYREALNSENIFYKFLSFFRIIETLGDDPKQWIYQNIDNLSDSGEKAKFLQRCKTKNRTAGEILYFDSRCALAHANLEKKVKKGWMIIDPDNPEDYYEIFLNLPIIKQLAELAIKDCLDYRS